MIEKNIPSTLPGISLWKRSLAAAPADAADMVTDDPEKKVLATKDLGTIKKFNSKNEYDFISGNDIKEALPSVLLHPKDHGTFPYDLHH